jgi:hypothetical protein
MPDEVDRISEVMVFNYLDGRDFRQYWPGIISVSASGGKVTHELEPEFKVEFLELDAWQPGKTSACA